MKSRPASLLQILGALALVTLAASACGTNEASEPPTVDASSLRIEESDGHLRAVKPHAAPPLELVADRMSNDRLSLVVTSGGKRVTAMLDATTLRVDGSGTVLSADEKRELGAFGAVVSARVQKTDLSSAGLGLLAFLAAAPEAAPLDLHTIPRSVGNDGIKCLEQGKTYEASYTTASGTVMKQTIANWSPNTSACLGGCGSACDLVTNYTLDCLEHDLCAGALEPGTIGVGAHCRDEWWQAADDFINTGSCDRLAAARTYVPAIGFQHPFTGEALTSVVTILNAGDIGVGVDANPLTYENALVEEHAFDGSEIRRRETLLDQGSFERLTSTSGPYDARSEKSLVVSSFKPIAVSIETMKASDQKTAAAGAVFGPRSAGRTLYAPLVMKNRQTADGLATMRFPIMNTSRDQTGAGRTANIKVRFMGSGPGLTCGQAETPACVQTFALAPYATYVIDLASLPDGFVGSAVIETRFADGTAGGAATGISYMFTSVGGVQSTVLPNEVDISAQWFVPLFLSRLDNGVSTPVSVMNPNDDAVEVSLSCTWRSGLTTPPFKTIIPAGGGSASAFNPVTEMAFPANQTGSCKISSTNGKPIVAYAQGRYVGTPKVAAREAIPLAPDGAGTYYYLVPYVERDGDGNRLLGDFATATTAQNIGNGEARVEFNYFGSGVNKSGIPNGDFKHVCHRIAPGAQVIHNHRVPNGAENATSFLPTYWQGSLLIRSDRPLGVDHQLERFAVPGDGYMTYRAIQALTQAQSFCP